MKCAHHPDRTALGYCSRCGKALCTQCLVRLSTGNFCEACANPQDRPRRGARVPWWAVVLAALAVLVLARLFVR